MSLQSYVVRGTQVIVLDGDYDASNAIDLQRELAVTVDGQARLVLDLSDVRYIDSSALEVLLAQAATWRARLRVVAPKSDVIRSLFELTGLATEFEVVDSVERATQP
jgi:anti-anti-sigma factor